MKEERPYQEQAIGETLSLWQQYQHLLGVAATGAGKTYMAARILRQALSSTGRAVFNAPRIEIVDATANTMRELGLSVGIVQADRRETHAQVIVGTKDSIANNLESILENGPIDIEITDEAHHCTAPSYQRIRTRLLAENPEMHSLGITATPQRSDGVALARTYQKIAFSISIEFLVQEGYLAKPISWKFIIPESATQEQIAQAVIDTWVERVHKAGRKRTMVFVPTTTRSAEIAAAFRARGFMFADISGNTSRQDRIDCMRLFEEGTLQGVVNDNVWTEGVDIVPSDSLINLKPTKSTTVFTQMVGRVLRIDLARYPEKRDAIILNFSPRGGQKLGFVNSDDLLGAKGYRLPELKGTEQDLFHKPALMRVPQKSGLGLFNEIMNTGGYS